jgi:hypothetical protein
VKGTRAGMMALGGAAVFALATGCLEPNQHTLVAVTGSHAASAHIDRILFTFQQGAPTGSTAGYVATPPAGPSGKPVQVDGSRFVRVDLTSAVAHDQRGDSTAPVAVYFSLGNVVQAKQFEDFEGHVGYVLGLKEQRPSTTVTVSRTADTVEVDVPTG